MSAVAAARKREGMEARGGPGTGRCRGSRFSPDHAGLRTLPAALGLLLSLGLIFCAAPAAAQLTTTCSGSSTYANTCSAPAPTCVFQTNSACTFSATSYGYASQVLRAACFLETARAPKARNAANSPAPPRALPPLAARAGGTGAPDSDLARDSECAAARDSESMRTF